jgi:hypothetical protein
MLMADDDTARGPGRSSPSLAENHLAYKRGQTQVLEGNERATLPS